MPIYDLFSNRTRPRADKLAYDALSDALRQHCLRIIWQGIGRHNVALCDRMDHVLHTEHPTPTFAGDRRRRLNDPWRRGITRFFEDCITRGDFFECIDAIEAGAHVINDDMRKAWSTRAYTYEAAQPSDDAIEELNARFTQHGVGYQFSKEQGRFIRLDSTLMHMEATKPAMALLAEKGFEGADQEFGKAQQHYRQMVVDPDAGKDSVAWAVKAVESTVKAIMDRRGWPYDKGDTIKKLLDKLFDNGIVPPELESYFGGLRSTLESGLPAIGNSMARHGQGAKPRPIEQHMVTLGMHLAAASILFLVEAHKAKEMPSPEPRHLDPTRPE